MFSIYKNKPFSKFEITGTTVSNELAYGIFRLFNSCKIKSSIQHRKAIPDKNLQHVYINNTTGYNALSVYPELTQQVESSIKIHKKCFELTKLGLAAKINKIETLNLRIPI